MPVASVELLFSIPRTELYSRLVGLIAASTSVSVVVGFLTEEGVSLVESALAARPGVLSTLVVGAATLKACDGLDRLIAAGVPGNRLHVHLGHSRLTSRSFVKYHPMMHSKVYLFEGAGRTTAIVGSHNLTGFAIAGQNTEASVLVEAASDDPFIQQVRQHIAAVAAEAIPYDPAMRVAYAWWFKQAFDGMRYKIMYSTGEEDVENKRNVLMIAARPSSGEPKPGDVIYLEVPSAFKMLKALGDPVHFYLLEQPPFAVSDALERLPSCVLAFEGEVVGTNERVVEGGRADWRIRDLTNPVLEPTGGHVSPRTGPDEVQAFVKIKNVLYERYVYVFESARRWEPVLDTSSIQAAEAVRPQLAKMKLIPAEDAPWHRVIGLNAGKESSKKLSLERDVSPESGRYLLYSKGRKLLSEIPNANEGDSGQIWLDIAAEAWYAVSKWAKDRAVLQSWQRRLAYSLGQLADRRQLPSNKQMKQGRALLLEAVRLGFTHTTLTDSLLDAVRSHQDPQDE